MKIMIRIGPPDVIWSLKGVKMSKMSEEQTWFKRYNDATYNLDFDRMGKARGEGGDWARKFIAKRLAENAKINYSPSLYPYVPYYPTFLPRMDQME